MKRPKPGDVIEIETPHGFAYAIFTHKHALNGYLLRVLRGLHVKRPSSIADLAHTSIVHEVFYPLGAAVNRQLVSVVGRIPLAGRLAEFPLFRFDFDVIMPPSGLRWLWDGTREWKVLDPDGKYDALPERGVFNHAALVALIDETETQGFSHWKTPPQRVSPGRTGKA